MKETSMTISVNRFANLLSRQITGVGFFQQAHARVLTQTEIDLAVSGVDRNYASRAALQKTIGEAAG